MAAIIAGGGNRKLAGERVIWIDTITSFSPSFTNSVSSHPIERGATVSDHVAKQNTKFSISGVIGGHSHVEYPDNEIISNSTPRGFTPSINLSANPRVQSAYDTLVALQETRSPITIVAELARYDNCVITSLSFSRMDEVLEVSLELEQVRYSTIQSVVRAIQVIPEKKDDATAKSTDGKSTTNGTQEERDKIKAEEESAWARYKKEFKEAQTLSPTEGG